MNALKKTLLVAFASQKGGVGKSTFTTLAASTMHYRLGYNVAVIDCDFPQYSIAQMRERDMKTILQNETFKQLAKRQFIDLDKNAYPVLQVKADSALEAAGQLLTDTDMQLDVIFFDLPGTVNSAGIITALAGMDYLFIPITADRIVLESALVFTQLITDVLMAQPNVNIREVQLFWNQVDGRERNPLYNVYGDFIRSLNLKLMKSAVSATVRFKKESESDTKAIFRSTLFPPDERLLQGCNLDMFLKEFIKLIQL